MKRICAVTGSRADWGLLRPVLRQLQAAPVGLQVLVTGSHLDPRFGNTVDAIIDDGFTIDARVPLSRRTDDAQGIADATGHALSGICQSLLKLRPDTLLVLGDRYEIFAAAQAALITRIPVAHIAGGDVSEGAYDDAMRHAITKLAHLHFTTNPDAQRRVLQMGEAQQRVFMTGSSGIDALLETPRWSRAQLQDKLGFDLRAKNLAITFHPATLDPLPPVEQITALLDAFDGFGDDTGLIFTGTNADTGGQAINDAIQRFVDARDNACFLQSLGQAGYYSLVEQADLVVGNSSSGLYEVPSLETPTLDIGMRQQGRLRGPSVRHVDTDATAIRKAIEDMLHNPPRDFTNPYGDGSASERIVAALLAIEDPQALLIKRFVERRL